MSIIQQLIPIYNTTVHENKELCCPKCRCPCHKSKDTNMPLGQIRQSVMEFFYVSNTTQLTKLINVIIYYISIVTNVNTFILENITHAMNIVSVMIKEPRESPNVNINYRDAHKKK